MLKKSAGEEGSSTVGKDVVSDKWTVVMPRANHVVKSSVSSNQEDNHRIESLRNE